MAGDIIHCDVGGRDLMKRLSSVEVLDVLAKEWHAAESIPSPRSSMKSTLLENTLYLMGGLNQTGPTKSVFKVALKELLSNLDKAAPTLWGAITETPLEQSTPIGVGSSLLAIGGRDNIIRRKPSSSILLYQPNTNMWLKVGDLSTARYLCASSLLPSGEIIVAGGDLEREYISDVEFLQVHY